MKILVAVLALGLAFWGYAFVYRGKTEPPAKYPVTNQDAAVYSLRGQIQMLSQQEELNTFAFEGRKKEKVSEYLFNDFELEKFRKTGQKSTELILFPD